MTAFSAAASVLFADPNLSVEATYRPAAGGSSTVRAIRTTPAATEFSGFGSGAVQTSYGADVLVSSVSSPQEGDEIEFDDGTFIVRKATLDPSLLVWRLDLNESE